MTPRRWLGASEAREALHVANLVQSLRAAEIFYRQEGRLETADAVRQIADATEIHGLAAWSCSAPLRGSAPLLDEEMGDRWFMRFVVRGRA